MIRQSNAQYPNKENNKITLETEQNKQTNNNNKNIYDEFLLREHV